ncbi:hypothetical protein [Brevibacillus borstelensis]|uniref:hypothetical protein n=1 Tax=Brevibacillus borstelensis TaxID=45462 RepID=UPI0030C5B031
MLKEIAVLRLLGVILATGPVYAAMTSSGSPVAISSADSSSDNPVDWKMVEKKPEMNVEMLKQLDADEAQAVRIIAYDTGIDLSEYKAVKKTLIFQMDRALFEEVQAVANIKNLKGGDMIPIIYLHDSHEKLYVLEKKHSGEGIATAFVLKDGKWEKTRIEAKG